MEQLQYTIDERKYVLIELLLTDKNRSQLDKAITDYDCVYQGVKEIKKGGFFTDGHAIIKYLVPEKSLIEFNKAIS